MRAIGSVVEEANDSVELYNVASEDAIDMHEVVEAVANEMAIKPPLITHTGACDEGGGWPGHPRVLYPDTHKLMALGWKARDNSRTVYTEIREGDAQRSKVPG